MKSPHGAFPVLLIIVVAGIAGAGLYFSGLFSGGGGTTEPNGDLLRYRSGDMDVGILLDPRTVRVGENRLVVYLRDADGNPVRGVDMEAFAEMPAMGAMPAMRAPADMRETGAGRYEGVLDLSMRGEWPLTIGFETPQGDPVRMQFDLATDRSELPIASGGAPVGSGATAAGEANAITIDSRRRQLIGVKTGQALHRDLRIQIRAVGEVTFDERLLSEVTLKFNGYIGDLKADYVGARIARDQVLFTVYSPELLAAQREYLEARARGANRGDELLRAARQRLALWDMTDDAIKALQERGEPQTFVAIHSPRSGTLIERHITDGSAAMAGQTLLTIADLSRVWVDAEIFEDDLDLVQAGMSATLSLPYLPGRVYEARVDYVYPYLDGQTRTGRIRLSLENPDGRLKPEMYAEVMLEAALGRKLSVPEEAVIVAGDSRVVFVDLGGGRLNPVRIKTGRRAGGFVEVLEGLSDGDTVVTSGNFLIAAETRLKTGVDQW